MYKICQNKHIFQAFNGIHLFACNFAGKNAGHALTNSACRFMSN